MSEDEKRKLLGALAGVAVRHPLVPVESIEFVECDVCLPKPGAPTLCAACQVNRASIHLLKARVRLLESQLRKLEEP